jgi:ATP-dependent RNA helicase DDX41
MDSTTKRRRIERSPSPSYKLDGDDDEYEPYIPLSQRRQEKLAKFSSLGVNAERQKAKRIQEEQEEREDALKEEERLREKARKERTLLVEAQEVQKRKADEGQSQPSVLEKPSNSPL